MPKEMLSLEERQNPLRLFTLSDRLESSIEVLLMNCQILLGGFWNFPFSGFPEKQKFIKFQKTPSKILQFNVPVLYQVSTGIFEF